jgi:hypothetical protein
MTISQTQPGSWRRGSRNRPSRGLRPVERRLMDALIKPPTPAFALAALVGILVAVVVLLLVTT